MAVVALKGAFMGANVKTSNFDGNTKSALYIDLYQADSEDTDKMVQVKTDDIGLINTLNKDYSMGSIFSCQASVNAYKNKAYYKLQKISK